MKPSKRVCEVRIRNVQRYGARLRRQREALDFAHYQAAALAAAGHSASDTAEGLTAVAVQLIQQQVLSVLLQSAQLDSSEQAGTDEARNPSPADYKEAARAPSEGSPLAFTDAEPKSLDIRELVRLTRITVDLNRFARARDQRAEQLSSQRRQQSTDQPPAEPQPTMLSEDAYQAIRSALRANGPIAPRSAAVPSMPGRSPAESTQPVSARPAAAEAQQSISVAIQPRLTADSRSYPHEKLDRIAADALAGLVWSAPEAASIGSLSHHSDDSSWTARRDALIGTWQQSHASFKAIDAMPSRLSTPSCACNAGTKNK